MKKILSLLLIVVMIMAAGSVHLVWADESETETATILFEEDTEDIENARDLLAAAEIEIGFADEASVFVSRADFLTAIVDAFNFETVEAETCFYDVSANDKYSGAVKTGLDLGIISKGTYFRPNDIITYFEACKMMTSALGYDNDALKRGGWPGGYVFIAKELGLADNLKVKENMPLYSAQAVIMLRNMLEAEIRLIQSIAVKNSKYVIRYGETDNLLGQLYGWYKIRGTVYGNELTHMYDSSAPQRRGCILIEDDVYVCEENILIGTYVYGYAVEEDGQNVIKYVETKSDILTLHPANDPRFERNVIKYSDEEGVEHKANLADNHATMFNGKAYLDVAAADYDINTGKLVLIDSDRNDEYDVVYIYSGDIAIADVVNTSFRTVIDNFIRPGERNAKKFDLLSKEIEYKLYSGNTEASASRITTGTVFEYYESKDGKNVEIHVLEKQITGYVTSTSENEIWIDDTLYKTTDYFKNRFKSNLSYNEELTFVLTEGNAVAAVLSNVNLANKLALVTGAAIEKGIDNSVKLRLFTENGENLILYVTEKVRINGSATVDSTDLLSYFTDDSGTLVRYATNNEDKITKLWLEEERAAKQDDSYYRPGIDNADTLRPFVIEGEDTDEIYYKSFGVFIPHFTIDADTKVFLVNTADGIAQEDKFGIGSMGSWSNDSIHALSTLRPYNVSTSGRAPILVMKSNTVDATIDNERSAGGIICSITKSINRQEEEALKIVVGTANTYSTVYFPKSHADYGKVSDASARTALRVGDYIMCSTDMYNNILSYRKDFDCNTKDIDDTYSSTDNAPLTYYYGELLKVENECYSLDIIDSSSGIEGNVSIKAHEMSDTRQNIWIVETSGSKRKVTSEALSALNKFMEQGYTLLVKLRYGAVIETCLYAPER